MMSRLGDAWTFVAIERHSKLVLAWHLGRRTERDTVAFTEKLAAATEGEFPNHHGRIQPYQDAVVLSLGVQGVDFAQLVKLYAASPESEKRYSPAECIGCKKIPVFGNPDPPRSALLMSSARTRPCECKCGDSLG